MGEAASIVSSQPTVLLVEDKEDDCILVTRAFMKADPGTGVQWLQDASGALSYLKGEGIYRDRTRYPLPSLVLVDLSLRGESGFQVLKWIRQQPELNDLPVWILSNSAAASDAFKAYQLNANAYIVKPGTPKEWTDFIENLQTCLLRASPAAQNTQVGDEND